LKLTDYVAVDFNACVQEGLIASDGKRVELGFGVAASRQ